MRNLYMDEHDRWRIIELVDLLWSLGALSNFDVYDEAIESAFTLFDKYGEYKHHN